MACLGPVQEDEFLEVLGRRWPTTVRAIPVEEFRNEVYFAVRPGIIWDSKPHLGRYQKIKIAIEPHRILMSMTNLVATTKILACEKDAMPVVF